MGTPRQIIARLLKLLTRQGDLVQEQGMTYLADMDTDNPLASLQAASCSYRIALGPRAGQKVLSLSTVPGRNEKAAAGLCADTHGFSLHAGVRAAIVPGPAQKPREHAEEHVPDDIVAKDKRGTDCQAVHFPQCGCKAVSALEVEELPRVWPQCTNLQDALVNGIGFQIEAQATWREVRFHIHRASSERLSPTHELSRIRGRAPQT